MSGSFQSHDYVPGVSGLKLDVKTGELELNSARLQVGTLPSDPQPITIAAGEWSDYDLPTNAIERYAFIGAELAKIPTEFRDSAEFTTEDFSFERDGSDYRTTLTYVRQETQEEAKARHEKAKVAGTRINLVGGVLSITHDGALRAQIGDLQKDEQPAPFLIVDGVTYINAASIKEYSPRGELNLGSLRFGGYTGDGPKPGDALKAAGVSAMLDRLDSKIGETALGRELKEQIEKLTLTQADQVREIIRAELRQGGLLWRRG